MVARVHWLVCGAVLAVAFSVSPAAAQVDFSGEWAPRFWEDQPERVPGPDLGDYAGIPISDAARLRAEAWDASIQSLPEWQCRPHSADYIWRGPSNLRISKEVDPVSREITAFHAEWLRSVDRAVYLDGRSRPPEDALPTGGSSPIEFSFGSPFFCELFDCPVARGEAEFNCGVRDGEAAF